MILGIGNDIVDIRRIEKSIERFGERFITRIFTPEEQEKALRQTEARHKRSGTFAKRFAAKEACLKALGIFNQGISWQDMNIVNKPSGKPVLKLSGQAKSALAKLIPPTMQAQIDLTMSDEFPHAQAIVIISATHYTSENS